MVLVTALFGAGLTTGLARFAVPTLVVIGLATAVALRGRDTVLLPLALLAGLLHGLAARANGATCVRNPLVVVAALPPCPWPARVEATGVRARLEATTERLYGPRAAIVKALVLGTRADMAPELRTAFARSGLVHLLAISGFHLGLIVAWVALAARLLRLSRPAALSVAAAVGVAYAGFLGWPAPATRAAALACLVAFCFARQRRVRAGPTLACTCLAVLLLEPRAVFDLGGWLSVSALWGASSATRWGEQAVGRHPAWRSLCASVGAVAATAPVTAAAFGTVALAGIALNLVAVPLAAAAVPGIFASLLLAPVLPSLAEGFAAGAGLALAGLERVAGAGASLPGGLVTTPLGWEGAARGALLAGAAAWIMADRTAWRESLRRAVLLLALGWVPLAALDWRLRSDGDGRLALFFLAVGQGDGAAIRTPGGQWVVVDAGPATDWRDAGRDVMVPFLERRGVARIRLLVVSHAHLDHLGGAGAVMDGLAVEAALEPGWPAADPRYRRFLDRVAAEGARWAAARDGDRWDLDGVRFEVLHPDTAWAGWGLDLNEDSVVLLVEYGAFRAVLTGDAGLPVERRLRGRVGPVDLLKVGHHGSRSATGEAWVAELAPRLAVLSVGRNTYGHPTPEVLERLTAAGASVWRTDREGTVVVRTDGCRVTVRAARRSWDYQREDSTCNAPPSPRSRPSSSSRSGPSPRPPGS